MNINEGITALEDLLAPEESGSILEPNLPEAQSAHSEVDKIADSVSPRYAPLFNMSGPQVSLQREKAWHRLAVILKASGMTDREIAVELDVTPPAVAVVCKQPWAVEMLLGRMHGAGDRAMARLQEEALAAAERLINIAKTAENDETRRKANNDILDRKYGKPNQPYTTSNKSAEEIGDSELMKIAKGN